MPTDPAILVDLSNVCRDEALVAKCGAVGWGPFDEIVGALERSAISYSRIHLIADRSLWYLFDEQARDRFSRLKRAGDIEVSELADERLLEYAFDSKSRFAGALVVSKDRFSDFRRAYPDIQGSQDRFIDWHVGSDGVVRTSFRDMGTDGHATMSRKEETGELKARRLRREEVRRRAVASYFRCTNANCLVARLWPEHLMELPTYDDRLGSFLCPGCRTVVEQAGQRPESVALVVLVDEVERARILLRRGETLAIGRVDGNARLGLKRLLSDVDSAAVSRSHLEFSWSGGQVQVRDLASKNGTSKRDRLGSPYYRLKEHEWTTIRRGQTILLPGSIAVELSGRTVPLEGERPLDRSPSDQTDHPTRLTR